MVGLYSYWVHHGDLNQNYVMFHGVSTQTMSELILFIFCVDVVINCLLVYGAHQVQWLILDKRYFSHVQERSALIIWRVECVRCLKKIWGTHCNFNHPFISRRFHKYVTNNLPWLQLNNKCNFLSRLQIFSLITVLYLHEMADIMVLFRVLQYARIVGWWY